MLASNLEGGRNNMMQTELPSHADAIFGTVGGLWTNQRSQDLLGLICNNKIASGDHAAPVTKVSLLFIVLLVDNTYPNNFFPIEKKEKKIDLTRG